VEFVAVGVAGLEHVLGGELDEVGGTCRVRGSGMIVSTIPGSSERALPVCSTRKLDLVRSLGADRVIDYTREDFAAGGQR
jgi:hypothetical protein